MSMSSALPTFARRNPAVTSIIVMILLAYVLAFFGLKDTMMKLAFLSETALQSPWSLLTYPFATGGFGKEFFWLLLSCLWLWNFGSPTESAQGSKKFVAIWLLASLAGAVFLWIGTAVLKTDSLLIGALVPTAAVTLIWCGRNAFQTIHFCGIVPVPSKILALVTTLIVFFGAGVDNPLLGFFLLIPLGAAYYYAMNATPRAGYNPAGMSRAEKKRQEKIELQRLDAAMDKQREREDKEKLRKLFERSLIEDPDEKQG